MNRGFSLVELSIVLVILGLLTGGILAGQSLIRASELRAVTTEYARFATAGQSFRDKYFAWPGDFSAGTRFWGRLNGNADCATASGAAVATPGTCDGDGWIEPGSGAGQSTEVFQFWRQLANAGLIEGTYSGLAGAGGANDTVLGTNSPRSKLNNGGWASLYLAGIYAGDAEAYSAEFGNALSMGAQFATAAPRNPVLKPEEAWNIDTKMDDGKPGTGKVVARFWNNACASGGAAATDTAVSVYKLTDSSVQCMLYFLRSF